MLKLFPNYIKLTAELGNPVTFIIQGLNPDVPDDSDEKVIVQLGCGTTALGEGTTLEEAAYEAGLLLLHQIILLYYTKEVPENIVWIGHTHPSINMN